MTISSYFSFLFSFPPQPFISSFLFTSNFKKIIWKLKHKIINSKFGVTNKKLLVRRLEPDMVQVLSETDSLNSLSTPKRLKSYKERTLWLRDQTPKRDLPLVSNRAPQQVDPPAKMGETAACCVMDFFPRWSGGDVCQPFVYSEAPHDSPIHHHPNPARPLLPTRGQGTPATLVTPLPSLPLK